MKAFVQYFYDNQDAFSDEALFVGLDSTQKATEQENLAAIEGA